MHVLSEIKDTDETFPSCHADFTGIVRPVALQMSATDGILKVYANIQGLYVSAMA